MKMIILAFVFITQTSLAQNLAPDFLCVTSGEPAVEISISNLDFAKTVSLKKGDKSCQFSIVAASYSERSVSPQIMIEFEKRESCTLAKSLKAMDEGFIKIMVMKEMNEAYVLILKGHQPLKCSVQEFKHKKIIDRIKNLF